MFLWCYSAGYLWRWTKIHWCFCRVSYFCFWYSYFRNSSIYQSFIGQPELYFSPHEFIIRNKAMMKQKHFAFHRVRKGVILHRGNELFIPCMPKPDKLQNALFLKIKPWIIFSPHNSCCSRCFPFRQHTINVE